MKIACLLMQKNEAALLDTWIKYHGKLFGWANLFIFDNGSTDLLVNKTLADSSQMGVSIINSFRKKEHFHKKGDVLGGFIKYLDETSSFDFFMPLDCDEFVAVETDGPDVKCDIGSIVSELGKFTDTKSPLAIKGSYFNIPNASGQFFFYPERKLIFRSKTFEWMDEGFHSGLTKNAQEPEFTKICHVHYANKPYDMGKSHAKEKLDGLVANFEKKTMENYEGSGSHLKRFFVCSESEYEAMHPPSGIFHPNFKKTLEELGVPVPFSDHWPPQGIVTERGSPEAKRRRPPSGARFWSNGKEYTLD